MPQSVWDACCNLLGNLQYINFTVFSLRNSMKIIEWTSEVTTETQEQSFLRKSGQLRRHSEVCGQSLWASSVTNVACLISSSVTFYFICLQTGFFFPLKTMSREYPSKCSIKQLTLKQSKLQMNREQAKTIKTFLKYSFFPLYLLIQATMLISWLSNKNSLFPLLQEQSWSMHWVL